MKHPLLFAMLTFCALSMVPQTTFTQTTLTQTASAQQATEQPPRLRFSVMGNYAFNRHTADFAELPGIPLFSSAPDALQNTKRPPNFVNGTGSGFSAGLGIEIPLSERLFLGVRGSYNNRSARLTTTETYPIRSQSGQVTESGSEYRLEAALSAITVEPVLMLNVAGGLNVFAGGSVGWMLRTNFAQSEHILTPDGFGFTPQTLEPTRNASAGVIPNAERLALSAVVGASYDIPLNARGTILLAPELSYTLGLTNLASNLAWKAHQIRAGLALKFSPIPEPAPIKVPEPPAAPQKPIKPVLAGRVSAVGVLPDGREEPNVIVVVAEETIARSVRPILPYIFFDTEGNTNIPARYRQLTSEQVASFRVDAAANSATAVSDAQLQSYYHVLNILAQRLQQFPQATLTITGCTDGVSSEKNDMETARQRAFAVRRYLSATWGIAAARLAVEAKKLSAKASVPLDEEEKMAENRRVELSSDVPQLLEPLALQTSEQYLRPLPLRIRPVVQTEAGIRSWNLALTQNGRSIKTMSGNKTFPSTLEWQPDSAEAASLQPSAPIEYELTVTDNAGNRITTDKQSITIRLVKTTTVNDEQISQSSQVSRRTQVDRYSLILFEFAKSELSPTNQTIVEYVRKRLSAQSAVTIEGFTDRTGNEDTNKRLALARAQAVAKALQLPALGIPNATINGYGASVQLYDNTLPEGRFYSRTVRITVESSLGNE